MRALALTAVLGVALQPVFKSGVEVVTVPITVTNATRDQLITAGQPLTNILPPLVGETGGVYWNITTPTAADFAAMSLLNELKYQYVLAYSPARALDGKYRRITVETTVQGLAVRHRGGYLALPPR